MRSVWDGGAGLRGYVSIEVDPTLAYDTDASREQAAQLHEQIDRPNLYVKIPGTEAGLPAIEDMIAAGRSINVTLIFSLERHREVMEAYIRGIERLVADGGDPSSVSSVASYFVSRVDTEADKRLEALGRPELRASSPSRTRSSPTATGRRSSRASAGRRSRRRAPRSSGVSGRRRPRRTRSTATSSTSSR